MRLTYKYENDNGYGSISLKHLPPEPLVDRLFYLDNAWKEERDKLGQYEDIDENPEKLTKIKKALKIIKENYLGIIWKTECNKEEIDLVKEVLSNE